MVRSRNLPIKILGTDWQFDGSSITVFYSTDPSGRAPIDADLAELNAAFAAQFGARVELRRLGARDETKVMTGVGTCGRELCCSSWLDKFSNISIRMAKEQDLPLNQSKLTGVCGRLKCCLIYELETYQEVKGKLPKLGETFHIPAVRERIVRHLRLRDDAGRQRGQGVDRRRSDGRRARAVYTAEELGVTFDAVPAHTRGVGSYGGDEVPRQERPTPVQDPGAKRKRRRRGRRGGRDRGGAPPPA